MKLRGSVRILSLIGCSVVGLVPLAGCGVDFESSGSDGDASLSDHAVPEDGAPSDHVSSDAVRHDGGSHDSGGPDGGFRDAIVFKDVSHEAAPKEVCPASVPTGACTAEGFACEYPGATSLIDPAVACDDVATCTGGSWVLTKPTASELCINTLLVGCPNDYTATTCDTAIADCYYASKARCACTKDQSGGGFTWGCDVVPEEVAVCPIPRRALGTTCSTTTNSTVCDYGGCNTLAGGLFESCKNGFWQEEPGACSNGTGTGTGH